MIPNEDIGPTEVKIPIVNGGMIRFMANTTKVRSFDFRTFSVPIPEIQGKTSFGRVTKFLFTLMKGTLLE
jgi:hypothetical protein